MGSREKFEKLVQRVPVDNDKLIGQAVSWFISKQDPENVSFNSYPNGYTIKVMAEGDRVEEAKQFWEENVHPYINGEE